MGILPVQYREKKKDSRAPGEGPSRIPERRKGGEEEVKAPPEKVHLVPPTVRLEEKRGKEKDYASFSGPYREGKEVNKGDLQRVTYFGDEGQEREGTRTQKLCKRHNTSYRVWPRKKRFWGKRLEGHSCLAAERKEGRPAPLCVPSRSGPGT